MGAFQVVEGERLVVCCCQTESLRPVFLVSDAPISLESLGNHNPSMRALSRLLKIWLSEGAQGTVPPEIAAESRSFILSMGFVSMHAFSGQVLIEYDSPKRYEEKRCRRS